MEITNRGFFTIGSSFADGDDDNAIIARRPDAKRIYFNRESFEQRNSAGTELLCSLFATDFN